MTYLPIHFREDNFPRINFKKIAANRNKRLYRFLKVVKNVFSVFARKPRKIETETKQDTPPRENSTIKNRLLNLRFYQPISISSSPFVG